MEIPLINVFTRNAQISSLELKPYLKKCTLIMQSMNAKTSPKNYGNFLTRQFLINIARIHLPPKLIKDGKVLENHEEISEKFNNYFSEIGLTIANFANPTGSNDFKSYLKNSVFSSIVLDPPQSVEIFNVINSLNPLKACGFDCISAAFLQLGNEVLVPVLLYYFSCAFVLGVFPNYFKTAKVIPILKSGNENLVSNYRPISLLTTLSKVLEKLIKGRLVKFFDKHDI